MVNTCCILGCHNKAGQGETVSSPGNQGGKTEEISARRQRSWVTIIGRRVQPSTRVYALHIYLKVSFLLYKKKTSTEMARVDS